MKRTHTSTHTHSPLRATAVAPFIMLAFTALALPRVNLVVNGSFEDTTIAEPFGITGIQANDITGWTATPGTFWYGGSWWGKAYSGDNCLNLQEASSIAQSFAVTTGWCYTVSFWAKSREPNTGNQGSVVATVSGVPFTGTGSLESDYTSTTYTKYLFSFKPTADGTATLTLNAGVSGGGNYGGKGYGAFVDLVSVSAQPVQLLTNGSFEDTVRAEPFSYTGIATNDIIGWTATPGTFHYGGSWWGQAYDGDNCLNLQEASSIAQSFAVTSGWRYTVSFWARSREPNAGPGGNQGSVVATVSGVPFTGTGSLESDYTSTTYTKYLFSFKPTATGTATLTLNAGVSGNGSYGGKGYGAFVDSASVVGQPLQGTLIRMH